MFDCSEYVCGSVNYFQKQSSGDVLCKKGALRNLAKFTGKQLRHSLFSNKVGGLGSATLLENRLWHRCFPVNFAKFLRAHFLTEHLCGLLLYFRKKLHLKCLTGF